MPSAGLQMFGAGLQLQQVTPGVQNTGNYNISGTGIAGKALAAYGNSRFLLTFGVNPNVNMAPWYNTTGTPDTRLNVMVGEDCTIVDSNTVQRFVSVGSDISVGAAGQVGKDQYTLVGYGINGQQSGNLNNVAKTTIFGASNAFTVSNAYGSSTNYGPIIVGAENNDSNARHDAVGVANIIIGHGITLGTCRNTHVLGLQYPDTNAISNKIDYLKIGNSAQREVLVGAYRLENPTNKIFNQTATGSATNTAAETTISAAGTGILTIAANRLAVGSLVSVGGYGVVGSAAGIQTLRIRIKTAGGVVLLDTGAATIPPSLAGCCFVLEASITARTIGAGGTVKCNGRIVIVDAASAAVYGWSGNITGTVALNTTADQTLIVTAQWGAADPANALDLEQLNVGVA